MFDLGSARGYGIEINLTRMNLLAPGRLHGEEDRANVSNGDFLIVGPGESLGRSFVMGVGTGRGVGTDGYWEGDGYL